jgi:uncharacterized protein (TIGR02118 family)
MILVSVLYPAGDDSTFDMDYYVDSHMPMVASKCGDQLKGMSVNEGLSGGAPGSTPTYAAMGHLMFESVDDFNAAFGPHAEAILGDVPNYTNISPVMQISEIKL